LAQAKRITRVTTNTGKRENAAIGNLGSDCNSTNQIERRASTAQEPLAVSLGRSDSKGEATELKPMAMKKTEARRAERRLGWNRVSEQMKGIATLVAISTNGHRSDFPLAMK
jgi:hypothetical protein